MTVAVERAKVRKVDEPKCDTTREQAQAAIDELRLLLNDGECACPTTRTIIVMGKNAAVTMDKIAHREELWTPTNTTAYSHLFDKLEKMLEEEWERIGGVPSLTAFANLVLETASIATPSGTQTKKQSRSAINELQRMLDKGTHGNCKCPATLAHLVAAKDIIVAKDTAAHMGTDVWTPEAEKAHDELRPKLFELLAAETKNTPLEIAFQAFAMVTAYFAGRLRCNQRDEAQAAA